jgi:hypothetical protein
VGANPRSIQANQRPFDGVQMVFPASRVRIALFRFDGLPGLHDELMMACPFVQELDFSQLLGLFRVFGDPFAGGNFLGRFAKELVRGGLSEVAKPRIHEDEAALPVLLKNPDRQLIQEQSVQRARFLRRLLRWIAFQESAAACNWFFHRKPAWLLGH